MLLFNSTLIPYHTTPSLNIIRETKRSFLINTLFPRPNLYLRPQHHLLTSTMKFHSAALISLLAISAYATPLLPRNANQKVAKPAACSIKAPNASNNATKPVEAPKPVEGPTPATNGTAAGNATAVAAVLPDGRIAQGAVPEDFNVLASKFKSAVVKGDGMCLAYPRNPICFYHCLRFLILHRPCVQ